MMKIGHDRCRGRSGFMKTGSTGAGFGEIVYHRGQGVLFGT